MWDGTDGGDGDDDGDGDGDDPYVPAPRARAQIQTRAAVEPVPVPEPVQDLRSTRPSKSKPKSKPKPAARAQTPALVSEPKYESETDAQSQASAHALALARPVRKRSTKTKLHLENLIAERHIYVCGIPDATKFLRAKLGHLDAIRPGIHFANLCTATFTLTQTNPLWTLSSPPHGGSAFGLQAFFDCGGDAYKCQPSVDHDNRVHLSNVHSPHIPFDYKNAAIVATFALLVTNSSDLALGMTVGTVTDFVEQSDESGEKRDSVRSLWAPMLYDAKPEKTTGDPAFRIRYKSATQVSDQATKFVAMNVPPVATNADGQAQTQTRKVDTERLSILTRAGGRWVVDEAKNAEACAATYTTVIHPRAQITETKTLTVPHVNAAESAIASDPSMTPQSVKRSIMLQSTNDMFCAVFVKGGGDAEKENVLAAKPNDEFEKYDDHQLPVCSIAELTRYDVKPCEDKNPEVMRDTLKRFKMKEWRTFPVFASQHAMLLDAYYAFLEFLDADRTGLERAYSKTLDTKMMFYKRPKWLNDERTVRSLTTDELVVVNAMRYFVDATSPAAKLLSAKMVTDRNVYLVPDSKGRDTECYRVNPFAIHSMLSNFHGGQYTRSKVNEDKDLSRIAVHVQPAHRRDMDKPFSVTITFGVIAAPTGINYQDADASAEQDEREHRPLTEGSIHPDDHERLIASR